VAELAAAAARGYGLPAEEITHVRRAGLVHDLGRLGVSNAIWDRPGALTGPEFERVRLHPYLSERILALSEDLAPLGALAVEHHERLDGSGYPRGLTGNAISLASRILAVADAEKMKIQAEAAASHNRVALDRMLIDQLPEIVKQAAQGLSGANLTVLNGADGLGEMATGLVGQGLAIFDSLRGGLGRHQSEDGSGQIGLNASPNDQP